MAGLLNVDFGKFLQNQGIKIDKEVPGTPQPKINRKPNDLQWFSREDLSPDSKEYLSSRHIDPEKVKGQLLELKQGFERGYFKRYYDSGHRLIVPMYTPKGECISCKFRKIGPLEEGEQKTYNQSGRTVFMIGWRNLSKIKEQDSVIVCEGEIDYASLYCADFHNVLAVPSATYTLKPEEIQALPKEVFLMLDSNRAGKEGVKRIARQIQTVRKEVRIKICELPTETEDVNELLAKCGGNLDQFWVQIEHSMLHAQYFIKAENSRSALKDRAAKWQQMAEESQHLPGGRPKSRIIKTGISSIDTLLNGGFRRGLYAIGGRPGVGKTNLVLSICDQLLQTEDNEDIYAIIFSVEMKGDELQNRIMSWKSGVHYNDMADERLNLIEVRKIQQAIEDNKHLGRLIIIDNDYDIEEMEKTIHSLRSSLPDSKLIFFFDYLQQIGSQKSGDKREKVGRISYKLKELSLQMESPFVVISSTSRVQYANKDNKVNLLAMFKESGDIEYSLYGALVFDPIENENMTLKESQKPVRALLVKHRFGSCIQKDGTYKQAEVTIDFRNGEIKDLNKMSEITTSRYAGF
jgi:replicative DNA helicase